MRDRKVAGRTPDGRKKKTGMGDHIWKKVLGIAKAKVETKISAISGPHKTEKLRSSLPREIKTSGETAACSESQRGSRHSKPTRVPDLQSSRSNPKH